MLIFTNILPFPDVLDFDVIVIGAGVHGSSAALNILTSGMKTLLIEQVS